MTSIHFLKHTLTQTYQSIRTHKLITALLILIQIILITTLSIVFFLYSIHIINNLNNIIGPIQQASQINQTQTTLTSALSISQNYQNLTHNIFMLITLTSITFILGNSIVWALTHQLFTKQKTFRQSIVAVIQCMTKYISTTLIILLPFALIVYSLTNYIIANNLTPDSLNTLFKVSGYIFCTLYLVLIYFYAFINQPSWRLYLHKIINPSSENKDKIQNEIQNKNQHKITPRTFFAHLIIILFIHAFLITLTTYLIYLSINANQEILPIILTFLLIIFLPLTRIHWICTLNQNITKSVNY